MAAAVAVPPINQKQLKTSSSSKGHDDVAGMSPSAAITGGVTPFMVACQQGQVDVVKSMIKKKKHIVRERVRGGRIALHFCAEGNHLGILELVLAADPFLVNSQDEEGYTPLHLAVINGNRPAVKAMLQAGADVNCLDNERHSLVHWATVCGELEILDLLLYHGAPASTPDIHQAHPIHYAAQMCGRSKGVKSASRIDRTDVTDHNSSSMYNEANNVSPKRGLVILKRLIQHHVPVDCRDRDGRQPLLWAASAGSGDAILCLVNAGGSVDAEDKDGLTGLHCAASRGHTDCLETLIGLCGCEVDVIDNNGCTALFYAVTLGHADCTELLLNYGAEPNRQDRKGRTPAHCGAAKGQLETIRLLAKHGGNLWLRNVRGDLPLHEAVLSRRKDLVIWLLSQRNDAVNAPNNDGRCPIHLAAINNNIEMIKILLDYRSEVNTLMRTGKGFTMTPLDAAIARGHADVAKFLQLHGGLASNSLTDAALIRRLNRSVNSQMMMSPGPTSSLQGSGLGSHDPSPDHHFHGNFTSPEALDPLPMDKDRAATFVTSTPIMHDSVQTDSSHYLRDVHVQVSADLHDPPEDTGTGNQVSGHLSSSSTLNKRGERRRRRRSPRDESRLTLGQSSSDSDRDAADASNVSRSRKGSRRSSQRGTSESSQAKSTGRLSEEKEMVRRQSVEIERQEELPETGHEGQEGQGSSDNLLDNTMMSEKFSELENMVNSSGTEAREEDLIGKAAGEVAKQRAGRSRSRSKAVDKDKNRFKERHHHHKSKSKSSSRKHSSERSDAAEGHHHKGHHRKSDTASTSEATVQTDAKSVTEKAALKKQAADSNRRRSKSLESSKEREHVENEKQKMSHSRSRDSIMKSRTPSGRRSNVSWHDDDPERKHSASSSRGRSATERFRDEERDDDILEEIETGRRISLQDAVANRRTSSKSKSKSPGTSEDGKQRQPNSVRGRSRSLSQRKRQDTSIVKRQNYMTRKAAEKDQSVPGNKSRAVSDRSVTRASEDREIALQEELISSTRRQKSFDRNSQNSSSVTLSPGKTPRRSSEEGQHVDSGFSDHIVVGVNNTSASEDHPRNTTKSTRARAGHGSILGSGSNAEETQSASTRGGSVTSDDVGRLATKRGTRRVLSRPRSTRLLSSRRSNPTNLDKPSPKPVKKTIDVDTPISVTQAMQASMRKYHLERAIFQELLELKRLQIRAGKSNEQVLVKRLADNYKRTTFSLNFRDYDGPFTFRNFEKYLYDQLRLLQANRRLLPRFAPSDDLEKLSSALRKMNATKLPFLDDPDRILDNSGVQPSEDTVLCSDQTQCTHSTHRCHHAAHAYTGVPCAAYIGKGRKGDRGTFLPKVNPLRAPGPMQKEFQSRTSQRKVINGSVSMRPPSSSQMRSMQISVSPGAGRGDSQSPITLEVQQGSSTQVFALPTQSLDPTKNYYVSLSIKPTPNSSVVPGDDRGDGALSAPPDTAVSVDLTSSHLHNMSM